MTRFVSPLNPDSLVGADVAEDFELVDAKAAEPATVVVLDGVGRGPGQRRPVRPAGGRVVSGAGDYRPAVVLDRGNGSANWRPVALVGKVVCKVDAGYGPIQIGDLLVTSPTPGTPWQLAT